MARTPRSTAQAAHHWIWRQLTSRTVIRLSLGILLAAASTLGVAHGGTRFVSFVMRSVEDQARFQFTLEEIDHTPVPPWIQSDLMAEVQFLSGLPDVLNALERNLAERIRDAFALHPWVREVQRVCVLPPDGIVVHMQYREPVALVRSAYSVEAVDRDGVLLPTSSLANAQMYLTITGTRSTPTGPAGTKWEDAAVLAGAQTAHSLAPYHRTLGLVTIDLSDFRQTLADSTKIYLLTRQGTRVKWGRPPGSEYPGDVPVSDKIDRLLSYVTEHGSLDLPDGPYRLDVTHWQEVTRLPRLQVPTNP